MLDLGVGKVLLFLIPGLFAYSALFGHFGSVFSLRKRGEDDEHRASAFQALAPPPNSIKAATIVVVASLAMHTVVAALILIVSGVAVLLVHAVPVLAAFDPDVLSRAAMALNSSDTSARAVFGVSMLALVEGSVAYLITGVWLRHRTLKNTLPRWLYGWTAPFANASDEDDKIVWAVVLTDQDVGGKSIAYAGIVVDLGLDSAASIKRINLVECERYNADMTADITSLPERPLSFFKHVSIESAHIRNVTFEVLDFAVVSAS